MTEKRYYQRNFEELYYIIDSEVISEEEFDEKIEYEGYSAFEDSLTGEEIVNLLNENEQLKQQVKDCLDKVDFYELWEFLNKLNDENEQLNSRIRYLENKIQREQNATTNQHLRWSKEAETKIKELSEENEELREQVKCLLEDLQSTNQINKEIVDDVREELLKENEQLKQQVKDCLDSVPFWETALDDKKKLQKENEQLKQQEKKLYNYFKDYFDNISEESFKESWELIKGKGDVE